MRTNKEEEEREGEAITTITPALCHCPLVAEWKNNWQDQLSLQKQLKTTQAFLIPNNIILLNKILHEINKQQN